MQSKNQFAMDTYGFNLFQRPQTRKSHNRPQTFTSSSIKVPLLRDREKNRRYLTCGLSQLLTQTYVRELQQLLPFLAFSFSVSAASCKTNSLGLKLKFKTDVGFGDRKGTSGAEVT